MVVFAPAEPGSPRRLLALGEAKWGEVMEPRHLAKLHRARDLLAVKGYDTRETVLACYGGAGFDPRLSESADRVVLVGVDQLTG